MLYDFYSTKCHLRACDVSLGRRMFSMLTHGEAVQQITYFKY